MFTLHVRMAGKMKREHSDYAVVSAEQAGLCI